MREVGAHHRIGSHFDAVGQFLERQLSFTCGIAQTVHRGVAVGVGDSDVHKVEYASVTDLVVAALAEHSV